METSNFLLNVEDYIEKNLEKDLHKIRLSLEYILILASFVGIPIIISIFFPNFHIIMDYTNQEINLFKDYPILNNFLIVLGIFWLYYFVTLKIIPEYKQENTIYQYFKSRDIIHVVYHRKLIKIIYALAFMVLIISFIMLVNELFLESIVSLFHDRLVEQQISLIFIVQLFLEFNRSLFYDRLVEQQTLIGIFIGSFFSSMISKRVLEFQMDLDDFRWFFAGSCFTIASQSNPMKKRIKYIKMGLNWLESDLKEFKKIEFSNKSTIIVTLKILDDGYQKNFCDLMERIIKTMSRDKIIKHILIFMKTDKPYYIFKDYSRFDKIKNILVSKTSIGIIVSIVIGISASMY